jgi:diaminopimelate epimerase
VLPFVKTQGLGNDFILIEEKLVEGRVYPALARSICDRRMGVGADGLILWKPDADGFRLRIVNSDGSEAECSGNGLRCVAAYLVGSGRAGGEAVLLETVSGRYALRRIRGDLYAADMGTPALEPARIPFRAGTPVEQVVDYPLRVGDREVRISACSTGNPHCSLFVEAIDSGFVNSMGPQLETHEAFPNGTNVEFIRVVNRAEIEVAFWERGAGRTPASGTGSCGAAVASVLNGRTDRRVTVHAENGDLDVEWGSDGRLTLVSTASVVAEGQFSDRMNLES